MTSIVALLKYGPWSASCQDLPCTYSLSATRQGSGRCRGRGAGTGTRPLCVLRSTGQPNESTNSRQSGMTIVPQDVFLVVLAWFHVNHSDLGDGHLRSWSLFVSWVRLILELLLLLTPKNILVIIGQYSISSPPRVCLLIFSLFSRSFSLLFAYLLWSNIQLSEDRSNLLLTSIRAVLLSVVATSS